MFSPVHFLRRCRLFTSQSFFHLCSSNGVPWEYEGRSTVDSASVCFYGGHRIFALQRSSAYDMGDSIRLEMEIRERNYLLHGTVLFVYRCYSFYVLFLFYSFPCPCLFSYFQGLSYLLPPEDHLLQKMLSISSVGFCYLTVSCGIQWAPSGCCLCLHLRCVDILLWLMYSILLPLRPLMKFVDVICSLLASACSINLQPWKLPDKVHHVTHR